MVDQNQQGLNLSATEIRDLTGWPEAMIEDYLNINQGLSQVVNEINTEITEINTEITSLIEDLSTESVNRARVVVVGKNLRKLQAEVSALEEELASLFNLIGNVAGSRSGSLIPIRKRLKALEETVSIPKGQNTAKLQRMAQALIQENSELRSQISVNSVKLRTHKRDLNRTIAARVLLGV